MPTAKDGGRGDVPELPVRSALDEGAADDQVLQAVEQNILRYLRSELARGRVTLFTGAGFSLDARNHEGAPVPGSPTLAEGIYRLCFGDAPRDESALEDLFQHALSVCPDRLAELLLRQLTVAPSSLGEEYALWFSMPWRRVYTLNIDDVERAVAERFAPARRIASVSALTAAGRARKPNVRRRDLEVVHLNGAVSDAPGGVTFSTTQYAARLACHDPWYERLVADLLDYPFVFVGTRLDESPLWQHLELVRTWRGAPPDEPRPRSFLVSPALERARRCLLEQHNIHWLAMPAREFARTVLAPMGDVVPVGLAALAENGADRPARSRRPRPGPLPCVRSPARPARGGAVRRR